MSDVIHRLASKVAIDANTGCAVYVGARDGGGYGMLRINGKTRRAHRISYEENVGPIPDGMCVCHHCDNRLCIEPSHLFLGTQAKNVADMDAKGRRRPTTGETHGSAKLTEADVISIRAAVGGWGLLTKLARQFGVSRPQIANIRAGRNWQHPITEEITKTHPDHVAAAQALIREIEGESE